MKFSAKPSGIPNGNRSTKISAAPGGGPSFAELIFLNATDEFLDGSAEGLRALGAMRRSNTANGKFARQVLSSFPGKGKIK